MKVFLVRFVVVASLFFGAAFISGIAEKSYLALPIWFTAVTVWTLSLGFRQALWVILPFLVVADILWDGTIGMLFLAGFLLAALTTYVTVRIETRSQSLQLPVYSFFISLFSFFVIIGSMGQLDGGLIPLLNTRLLGIFASQLIVAVVFFLPISFILHWLEKWLDTSYQEQSKKIR